MSDLLVRRVRFFFLFVVLFQILSLPLVFAETASGAAQSEKPSSPVEIQKALAEAGFYKGAIDGIIGAKTRAAIRSFQEEHGLSVDGLVGLKTWEKLKAYLEEAEEMDSDKDLTQPAVEETPDDTLTLEAEPEPLARDEDLKQKLVS